MAAGARKKKERASAPRSHPAPVQPVFHSLQRFEVAACFVLIFAAGVIVYIPAMSGAFVWDDEPWISGNPLVRAENQNVWQALAAIWSGSEGVDYYPLTTTLHWIEWQLFGANPAAFHIINILLHAANSVLVWRVLKAIGVPGAWLAGLIFAVHPVHAASTAWISEAKNTLSLLFYLSSFLAFVRFERTAQVRCYVGALLLFAGGLLAKTHGVFIPAVLVLYAWWRHGFSSLTSDRTADRRELRALRASNLLLGAIGLAAGAAATYYLWTLSTWFHANSADPHVVAANVFADGRMRMTFPLLALVLLTSGCVGLFATKFADRFNKHLVRTFAFFQLSALLGAVTVWVQHGAIGEHIEQGGIARRLANAGSAVWWYIGKAFAPVELAAVYPPWEFGPPAFADFLPLAGIIAAAFGLWIFRGKLGSHALFAFAAFALLILPVLGLVTMAYGRSGTLVADHFQYLANIPIIAAAAAAVVWIWKRGSTLPRAAIALLGVVSIVAMSASTWARATVYRTEESLWRDTLAKNPDTWQGHNRLGQLLFARGDVAAATGHYRRAAALKPDLAPNHNNLGLAYARQRMFPQAVAAYREALAHSPPHANTTATFRINLANVLGAWANQIESESGSLDEARQLYEEAVSEYRAVLALDERNAAAHRNVALVLMQLGRTAEAAEHLRTTLRLIPNEPLATEMLRELEDGG